MPCMGSFWSCVPLMMTSSNGNIFRVTGHLCGKFTGPRWISHTKASDAELWCLLWSARINSWVNNGEAGDLRRHSGHYDVIVMFPISFMPPTNIQGRSWAEAERPGPQLENVKKNNNPESIFKRNSILSLSNIVTLSLHICVYICIYDSLSITDWSWMITRHSYFWCEYDLVIINPRATKHISIIVTSGDVYPSYVRFVGPVHSVYSTYAYFVYLNMTFTFSASLWRENIQFRPKIRKLQSF